MNQLLTRILPLVPLLAGAPTVLVAQFTPLAPIAFDTSGPVLRADAQPQKPFTVAGPHGVLLGSQDGSLEAWILPVKIFSNLRIEADIAGYPVPIDVNQHAASIEVRPDRTIITYSHLGFTVRQIMFSPGADAAGSGAISNKGSKDGAGSGSQGWRTGPVILYEFDCLHPTDFTFRFTPDLQWMWPARNEGVPGVEWEAHPFHRGGSSPGGTGKSGQANGPIGGSASTGLYILHTDYPDLAAAVTIPGAEPGILTPYQERPQVHPVELRVHIDPARDNGRLFPLLMAVGTDTASATSAALARSLEELNADIPSLYAADARRYREVLAHAVSITTPDAALDEAFQWAVVSIEQLRTSVFEPRGCATATAVPCSASPESALVAGYYTSADSTRPGFGWFFGRDALYTLYAVNGFGDFALTRAELEFLIRRQRADGKIMHEYSQTAPLLDWWPGFPYMYAAADSTPLFLMAVADYIRASGDTAFLATHRDAIERAWAFETDPAHDANHDGIYDNSQGTGWVESWPGGLPHQEIYIALLDQQASSAYSYLESQVHDDAKAQAAGARAAAIAKTINATYHDSEKGCYAFAVNAAPIDGRNHFELVPMPLEGRPAGQRSLNSTVDRTTTIFPAVAWWDPQAGKTPIPDSKIRNSGILDEPGPCLRNFIASALDTDWGTRDIADTEKIYDGMSYHQGSVWPLFTGWAALAEYRGNQPLAGYELLKENASLTTTQDVGAVTELLSGDFFVPFGRSTSHQLWSSAMVITPTLRGLFGISVDAQSKTITVNPHLPANWDHAEVRNLPIGGQNGEQMVDLHFVRDKGAIVVSLGGAGRGISLLTSQPDARTAHNEQDLRIPDHAVQIAPVFQEPLPGSRARAARIVDEEYSGRTLTLAIEGLAGSEARFPLVVSAPGVKLRVAGADLLAPDLLVPVGVEASAEQASQGKSTRGKLTRGKDTRPRVSQPPEAIGVHFPPGPGWQTITVTLSW